MNWESHRYSHQEGFERSRGSLGPRAQEKLGVLGVQKARESVHSLEEQQSQSLNRSFCGAETRGLWKALPSGWGEGR